ncbi:hypothetical protein AX16_005071 [Volvariella volvacea WC 439]|nr:hypothetical protein AX16_005071 [Volvariella volvacea WC 439]
MYRLESILSEICVIHGGDDYELFRDLDAHFCDRRYPSRSQVHHIRHLSLNNGSSATLDNNQIFSLLECYNLQNIRLLEFPETILSDISSIIHSPHRTVSPGGLARLEVCLSDLFPLPGQRIDFNHEILRYLTRLNLLDTPDELGDWEDGNNLACLKDLKSLCVNYAFPMEFIQKILEECEALEVLIVCDSYFSQSILHNLEEQLPKTRRRLTAGGGAEEVPEDRVVLLGPGVLEGCSGWYKDWVLGAMGGNDVFAKAERTVQERRRERMMAGMQP